MAGKLSLNPETFVAGGLITDDNVIIRDNSFTTFTYPNGIQTVAWVAKIEKSDGDIVEQVFSIGSPDDFQATEDGKSIEIRPDSKKTALSASCNFAYFAKSLCDAGFNAADMDEGFTDKINGMSLHVVSKSLGKQGNSEKDRIVLVVESILDSSDSGNSKATPAANAGSNADTDTAVEIVTMIIAEAGGTIAKSKIVPAAFKAAKENHPDNPGLMKIIANPKFIGEHFDINGTDVSLR